MLPVRSSSGFQPPPISAAGVVLLQAGAGPVVTAAAESLSRASVPQHADQPPVAPKKFGPFGEGAPFVVLEHLLVGGAPVVRVVCTTDNEDESYTVANALAEVGLRVWHVDLQGDEDGPSITRYIGGAAAAWLHSQGEEPTSRGAGDKATDAGW